MRISILIAIIVIGAVASYYGCQQPAPKSSSIKLTPRRRAESDSPPAPPSTSSDERGAKAAGPAPGMAVSLNSGIPGEGDLTNEQLERWLDERRAETASLEAPSAWANFGGQLEFAHGEFELGTLRIAEVELGRQLFFDSRMSSNGTLSCASCHHPDYGFGQLTQLAAPPEGAGASNAPSLYNAAFRRAYHWDGGGGESLEQQAVAALTSPRQLANDPAELVERVESLDGYALQMRLLYPDGVTVENLARAIGAFERTLLTGPSPADHFERLLAWDQSHPQWKPERRAGSASTALDEDRSRLAEQAERHPLSPAAVRGRQLFFGQARCVACHRGPLLDDGQWHNIGIGESPAEGRAAITGDPQDRGRFRTPSLRNVAETAPYMHDGSLKSLEDVVAHYNRGGQPHDNLDPAIGPLSLSDQQQRDLVTYLRQLSGAPPTVQRGRLPSGRIVFAPPAPAAPPAAPVADPADASSQRGAWLSAESLTRGQWVGQPLTMRFGKLPQDIPDSLFAASQRLADDLRVVIRFSGEEDSPHSRRMALTVYLEGRVWREAQARWRWDPETLQLRLDWEHAAQGAERQAQLQLIPQTADRFETLPLNAEFPLPAMRFRRLR